MSKKVKKGRGLFLRQGLKEFKTNGSLFPSSKFLGNKMLKYVELKSGICIIELGAGTGAFTKQILEILPTDGRLIVFEINPKLVKFLRDTFNDKRVIIIEGDAKNIKLCLDRLPVKISRIDYIISGLPLGTFSSRLRREILLSIREVLGRDGVYIQFQYFLASYISIKRFFRAKIIGYEYRNMPPAFVYLCRNK